LHQAQKPSGAKSLVSLSISRRSSGGGLGTVWDAFAGSDTFTRAALGSPAEFEHLIRRATDGASAPDLP